MTYPNSSRLLMLSHEDPARARGGLGIVVGELCREFASLGVHITLVTGTEPAQHSERREPALDPYALPRIEERDPALSSFAERALSAARASLPTAIHAHDWVAVDAGLRVQKELGLPLIAHVHSTEWDRSLGRVDPWVLEREGAGLRAATRVLCVSEATRALVVERYGLAPKRVVVVHPGVPQLAQPKSSSDSGSAPTKSPCASPPTVLFLGRLVPQKGIDLFLRSALLIRAALPSTRFVVAGDGPCFDDALERSIEMGLARHLRFTGHVNRASVPQLLQRASALLVPSLAEPFGLVGLEAAQAGVPVVASRACGFTEALPAFATFEALDAGAAASAVIEALQTPMRVRQWREQAAASLDRLESGAVAADTLSKILPVPGKCETAGTLRSNPILAPQP
ncbi:MAG: glycogen(starch) synthase [Planctomycetota bacterium]|jgi:glycogen(starch) synthase